MVHAPQSGMSGAGSLLLLLATIVLSGPVHAHAEPWSDERTATQSGPGASSAPDDSLEAGRPPSTSVAPDLRPPRAGASNAASLDLFTLRQLVADDPDARERCDALKARRMGSVILLGSAAAGVATATVLAFAEAQRGVIDDRVSCVIGGMFGPPSPCRETQRNYTSAYAALGVSAVLGVVALLFWPRQGAVDAIAADWRARHQDPVAGPPDGLPAGAPPTEPPPGDAAH